MVAHHLHKCLAQGHFPSTTQQPGSSRVDKLHPAVGVGDNHPIGHMLKNGGQTTLLFSQTRHFLTELVGHVVEGQGKLAHFITTGRVEMGTQIPFSHPFCHPRQAAHRSGSALGNKQGYEHSQQCHKQPCRQDDLA